MFKYSVISAFLGQTKDRFCYYNENKTLEEKLKMVVEMEGMTGVELVHPYEVEDPENTLRLLKAHNVLVAAINVNVKAEPEFVNGGITSSDSAVRDKVVEYIRRAKDFAVAVGGDKVTCCPLSDGYEFSFQSDYMETWKRLIEVFGKAASYRPEIPLFIEYKPSEVRARCTLDDAAKTLCLIKEIGNDALGVTLDYGHSLYGGNNPAEELALLEHSKVKYYIHINDNNRKWDWDLFCGSHSLLEYFEFIYYLKKFGYQDFLTSDTSPTRWDIRKMFEANIRVTDKISQLIDRAGMDKIDDLLTCGEYMDAWRFIEENLLFPSS